ncbi:hypothetical protein BD310DRAFT_518712 [Dichomitus squalens]|uniref:Uncharacterized protein n=1 Tax=Dichomitus squalens TaxID=114155 RepID=A0A4V2K9F4_9APHY|nr:hypothetical protein BD310DRAFT_518712 [Dichomitus squalens]
MAMMSDDARSIHTRQPRRRRVLVVSNASPPESSSDEDLRPEPQPKSFPRPLPSPSSSHSYTEPIYPERHYGTGSNSHIPTRLHTTDIRYPSSHSNPSNPALSSPSSASSPAADLTPPPSTPGLGSTSLHISDEGTIRQDMINPVASDRYESAPSVSRPAKLAERMRSQGPGQLPRRNSSSGSRPATVCSDPSLPP